MQSSSFHGLPTQVLTNEWLCLEYLKTAGPRIVRLSLAGKTKNLLAETPDVSWPTDHGDYHLRGGHRLWVAPESLQITSAPDDDPVEIELTSEGVKLHQAPDPRTKLQKTIHIKLDHQRAAVTLDHLITNQGTVPTEIAPWSITQLPLGGLAVMPQPTYPREPTGRLPNRQITLWPYTKLKDVRLTVEDDFIFLAGVDGLSPCKIGGRNPAGWLCYAFPGTIFMKSSPFETGAEYPDWGCNTELYLGDQCIELETLGPIVKLDPGSIIQHTETWEIFQTPGIEITPKGLRRWCNSALTYPLFPI